MMRVEGRMDRTSKTGARANNIQKETILTILLYIYI